MAKTLQTPQIIHINAFDPTIDYNVEFVYDDNQSVKNRLVITNNETSMVVYDQIQIGMVLYHTIPANTLVSGVQYTVQVQVFDTDGNQSNLSDAILFYCYTTPLFSISGISNEELINKANLTITLNYSQEDGEELKDFQFFLYDSDMSLKNQSNILYSSSEMTYTFNSLDNEKSYYIRSIGTTVHGMQLDTDYILFHVQYVKIPANIIFEVENNQKSGYITLFSGIIDIGYDLLNDSYILEEGLLTLFNNNKLTYNKGFSITSDFILHIEAKQLPLGMAFLYLNNDVYLSVENVCGNYYCKLNGVKTEHYAELPKARIATSDTDKYLSTSDDKVLQIINASYEDGDLVVFEVKRVNGIYGLSAYYKSDVYG